MAVKIALLGIGSMGKNHLRVLSMLRGVEICRIFDVNESELKKLSAQYSVPYTLNLDEAIDGVDAVVIVTSTSTHFDYFSKCVGKVKNIFVEKPLASSYEQACLMEELATKHGTFVQCGFIERFNPVIAELKNVLIEKEVINMDFTRTNRLSSRISDVDVVLDLMIHDLDLALYLNGPVENIVAYGKKEDGLIAFASVMLEHSNGALSRVLASRMTEKKMRSIQVTTTDAFIDAELVKKELVVHKQSSISQEEGKPYIISSFEQQLEVKPQEALLVECQVFVAACNGEIDPNLPGIKAGVESLRISKQIVEKIGK
ncbi:Gfo/Idh/MocA family oxidoreductase [Pseudomonadales bacterium]|nr:Gfo/Idh/MocA family oxidoreductase [Pseudomonadales bacterium]